MSQIDITFSIIIVFKNLNTNLINCLNKLKHLEYDHYEIILISENKIDNSIFPDPKKTRFFLSISSLPGAKRNLAATKAKYKYLIFLDDDSYPPSMWLNNACKYIFNHNTNCMGGSGISPKDQNFFSQISETFFQSVLSYGAIERYFVVNKIFQVRDWPSMNFFIKKEIFFLVNGFDESIYPGEDSVLCSNLIKNNQEIYYFPDIYVYHNRRENIFLFIKQIFLYGFHRGKISLNKGRYSFEFKYILPSIYIFFLFFFIFISFFEDYIVFSKIYFGALVFYYTLVWLELYLMRKVNFFKSLFSFFFAPLGHMVYGISSLIGLFSNNFKK